MQARGAFRQTGCHDQILGSRYCGKIQIDSRTLETAGFRMNIAMLDLDFSAHHGKPL